MTAGWRGVGMFLVAGLWGGLAAGGCTVFPADVGGDGGAYYLDDGPPAGGEGGGRAVPDAVVRAEKILPGRNKPYVAEGRRYVPFTRLQPYRKRGVASWYGRRYHGRRTASGEVYDMYAMSAAHTILPIPSFARVTRTDTGESVVVRVNDRGPFLGGREIDLSYAAAARLGFVKAGTAEVVVEAVLPEGAASAAGGGGEVGGWVERVDARGGRVFLQLGAFGTRAAAVRFADEVRVALSDALGRRVGVAHLSESGLFGVRLGPYESHAAAVVDDEVVCGRYGWCGFLRRGSR